jgi:hypothetical protein
MEVMAKGKISATVDEPLLEFLDSLPGRTRSEKLERVLSAVKRSAQEKKLRSELREYWKRESGGERAEREAWDRTVAEVMWNE